jgi:GH3 auxin-responsive promoter
MAILGTLLKKGIKLRENLEQEYTSPLELQKKELKELMITASQTEFGKYYDFHRILEQFRRGGHKDFYNTFKESIPIHDYNKTIKTGGSWLCGVPKIFAGPVV